MNTRPDTLQNSTNMLMRLMAEGKITPADLNGLANGTLKIVPASSIETNTKGWIADILETGMTVHLVITPDMRYDITGKPLPQHTVDTPFLIGKWGVRTNIMEHVGVFVHIVSDTLNFNGWVCVDNVKVV